MWIENPIFEEDLKIIVSDKNIPWDELKGKNILITGGTGLIGYTLISALIYYMVKTGTKMQVIALVRNVEKAEKIFFSQLKSACGNFLLLKGDITKKLSVPYSIDYIIHGASKTESSFFVEHPIETIETSVQGTKNILELAREKNIKGMVYLSSMEVYGSAKNDAPIFETYGTTVNTMCVRSCYPESKRMCENLCVAYEQEYGIRIMVARLAQTFGPGVSCNDKRVFSQFAQCVLKCQDIVLLTAGDSKHSYLYTFDAVAGILNILLSGKAGEAYNIANMDTYCSIYEMAVLVAKKIANGRIAVTIQKNEESLKKFPATHYLNLDTKKLESLGWKPKKNLMEMYYRMISSMKI